MQKILIDKLVEECSENIDEVKLTKITLAEHGNKYENMCECSCTPSIVFFSILFTIKIGIGTFCTFSFTTNTLIFIKKQLLNKILFLKQFTEHIKMTVTSTNIKK